MKNLLTISILFLLPLGIFSQNTWHVAVDGTSSGNGTIGNPWDLQTALSQPTSVRPGDTILLHGGVYKGNYVSSLTGTATARIYVKPYDKYSIPILDHWEWKLYNIGVGDQHTLITNGGYTDYIGIGFVSSCPYHFSLITGSNPATTLSSQGIYVYGTHTNVINCFVFYQNGVGIGFWAGNDGGIQYGNIVGLNGRVSTDRGHGQSSYVQNYQGSDYKHLENNVWFKSCSYGMKIYAQEPRVNNVYVENNIAFMAGTPSWSYDGNKDVELYSGDNTVNGDGENIFFRNNSVYQLDTARNAGIALNVYGSATNFEAVNNTVMNGLYGIKITGLSGGSRVDNNFVYGSSSIFSYRAHSVDGDGGFDSFNNNTYFQKDPALDNVDFIYAYTSFTQWLLDHPDFDRNSTYTKGEPSYNIVNVYPNEYEQGRAHVAIFNFTGATSQNVDLSNVCSVGDSVIVYDVEHLFGDNALIKTIYSGDDITFPLNLTQQDAVPEYSDEVKHSPDDFNSYLVMSHTLNLPVVNKGAAHVSSEIIIDNLNNNGDGTYTVRFHDLHPYPEVVYDMMLQTKFEGPSQVYVVLENVSDGYTFNMLDIFPDAGTTTYVVGVMNDSTFSETEFDYLSLRDNEMISAGIREEDNLMFTYHFNAIAGQKEYGYLYDVNGNQLGESTYHVSVSGVNTIYYRYYQGSTISAQPFKMVVVNTTTGTKDSLILSKTLDAYNYLHIYNWSLNMVSGNVELIYYRGQNYKDTLRIYNSSNELLYESEMSDVVGNNIVITDMNNYPDGTYTVVISDGHTSDKATYVKGIPPAIYITNCLPNPTCGEFVLKFNSEKSGDVNVTVLNSSKAEVWQNSLSAVKGANSVNIDISGELSGDYAVVVNNGTDSDTSTIAKQDAKVLSITSYSPNPTYDIVTFILDSPAAVSIDIVVTNSLGEEVQSQSFSAVTGSNSVDIDLTSFPVGVYTISFNDGTSPVVSRDVTREEKPRELEIISCSPNPTYNSIFVKYYSPVAGNVTVRVVNSSGAEVLTKEHTAIEGENNSVEVDLTGNVTGIYYITLNNGTTTTESYAVTKQDEVAPPQPLTITNNTKITDGLADVNFYSPSDITVTYEVINASKMSVENGDFAAQIGNNTLKLNLFDYLAGNYIVVVNDGTDSDTCTITKQDAEVLSITSYSPNSTYDIVTFILDSPAAVSIDVVVTNSLDEEVQSQSFSAVTGSNSVDVDLSSLSVGVYTISFNDGTSPVVSRDVTREETPRELEIISCSPNPTYNSVFAKYYSPVAGNVTVRVVNSSGAEVLTKEHSAIEGENNSVEVDLTGNVTGVYYITLNNGTTTTEPYAVTKQDEVAPPQPLTITGNTETTYGLVDVNFYSPSDISVVYEVFNTSGVSVENGNFAAKTGNNTLILNFSNYLAGNYRLLLNDGTSTDECNVEKLEEVEETVLFERVAALPNPTIDIFTVTFKSPAAGEVHVEVIDDVNRIVMKDDYIVMKGMNRVVLNIGDLDPGAYIVVIANGVDEPIKTPVTRQAYYK